MAIARLRLYILVLTVALALPAPAAALTCVGWDDPALEFERADAVFSGWLVDWGPEGRELRFRVSRSWKGVESRDVRIIHADYYWDGDRVLPAGKYYVFAKSDATERALYAPTCREPLHFWFDRDGAFEAFLGQQPKLELKGTAPWPRPEQALPFAKGLLLWLLYIVLVEWRVTAVSALGLFVAAIWWRRRRLGGRAMDEGSTTPQTL